MLRLLTSSIRARTFTSSASIRHENPLGLPRRNPNPAPTIPRRTGPPQKRHIPNVSRVLVVASGKGGVGKSTTAVNLATALAMNRVHARVGLLDLDIFGPSIPRLMGLTKAEEPLLTSNGALVPLMNHGLSCMSMGFLMPQAPPSPDSMPGADDGMDKPVVWRGLMVQKAVQQLLFDVDWRKGAATSNPGRGLDVLVIDMPPGTGDVPLTLGQLVHVEGSVIVSTPQSVALDDVRKGLSTFKKLNIPITGLLLNTSHTYCPSCSEPHPIFGSAEPFRALASRLNLPVLGELPLVPGVVEASDAGIPYALWRMGKGLDTAHSDGDNGVRGAKMADKEWSEVMDSVASKVWRNLEEA